MGVNRAIQTCAIAAAAVLLTISSFSASAGTNHYRWLNERGNPVHSDRPPPQGIDYEVITTGSSLIRQVQADEGAVPAEVEPRVGNDFEQVDTQPPDIEKNPEYCQRARNNLATLDSAPRIRIRNDQGEFRYLSNEEKETERLKAVDAISVHCD